MTLDCVANVAEAITKGIQLLEETKGRSSFEVKILREKLNFEAEQALSLFFFLLTKQSLV